MKYYNQTPLKPIIHGPPNEKQKLCKIFPLKDHRHKSEQLHQEVGDLFLACILTTTPMFLLIISNT